jgi:hypothetical protein
MTEQDAEILETELKVTIGATLAVTTSPTGFQDWIRPSTTYGRKWRGAPSATQVQLARQDITNTVLVPTLDEIIQQMHERLIEARRG